MTINRNQRGFSLLEVMVALFIAVLVCGLAFRIIGSSSQLAVRNQLQLQQLQLAENKLNELAQQPHLWLGHHQGDLDSRLQWRSHIQPAPDVAPHKRWALYRIEVELFRTESEQSLFQLSTLQLGRHP